MEKFDTKKRNIITPLIIIFLSIVILGLCIYIFLDNKEAITSQSINEKASINDSLKDGSNTYSGILLDDNNLINGSDYNYTLACQGNAGIWVTVDSTLKKLLFEFNPSRVSDAYSLNWENPQNSSISSTINFDTKISGVFFGSMGQNIFGDTLFILLEDGSVEFIPIVHMLKNWQGEAKSYGKLDDVKDVVRFTLSGTNSTNGVTTLAFKGDGTFYDLSLVLRNTEYY